jgi:DNA-directed RNA polymerase specialized sigma24 family protein
MRGEADDTGERFAAFVRGHGERHLRLAVLLTGDWHAAEDLVQASLVKLYQAWPRLETDADPDAYLRRVVVNTHRSWWRARPPPAREIALAPVDRWLVEYLQLTEIEQRGVLESDGVTAVAIIGVDELDAVWQLARFYGPVGSACFIVGWLR